MSSFTFDIPEGQAPPAPGDVLAPTKGARAWYLVEGIRPVESRQNPNRWRLQVRRIEPTHQPEEGARMHPYERIPRGG